MFPNIGPKAKKQNIQKSPQKSIAKPALVDLRNINSTHVDMIIADDR